MTSYCVFYVTCSVQNMRKCNIGTPYAVQYRAPDSCTRVSSQVEKICCNIRFSINQITWKQLTSCYYATIEACFTYMFTIILWDCFSIKLFKNAVFWDVCCVALVRTDVLGELSASFIRVTRIGELGTTLAVTSNRRTLRRRNIPEDTILHSHSRENLKSYINCSTLLSTI
jgi:hypothetical protein